MRPLAILLVASAPLAAITAWSVAELFAIRSRVASDAPVEAAEAGSLAAQGQVRAEADKVLASALSRADLLTTPSLPLLEAAPADSPPHGLQESWRAWVEARTAAQEFLALDSAVVARIAARADAPGLKATREQLETLRGKLQAAKIEGVGAIVNLVDRRIGDLSSRAKQLQQEDEAAALAAEAEVALERKQLEQALLRDWERQGSELRAQAAREARLRDARAAVEQLETSPPKEFDARVARAAGLLGQYPEPQVKALLKERIPRWLAEAMSPKQIGEPAELQEAEARGLGLLRGYFREVIAADGSPGYKCYATYADLLKPKADVGTHQAAELVRPPGPSVLRSALEQYRQSRQRLLEHPGRRESWVEFAALCERLQKELDEYRRKPGAAQEELRFDHEAELARKVLSGPTWGQLEQIAGEKRPQ